MQRLISRVLLFVAITISTSASAQDSGFVSTSTRDLSAYQGRPRVKAVRLNAGETISTDGRLNEPVWQRAIPATDFMQQDPNLGQPATERTEVRFVFNGTTLYMGVTCYDSQPENLKGNNMLRDGSLAADDRFVWAFDTYLDGRSGYYFEMNPSGAMGDSLIGSSFNAGGGIARAWDGIWYAKVNKSDIGWTIEIEIPFRTLNFDPNAPAWGANFQRTVRRSNEESLWMGHSIGWWEGDELVVDTTNFTFDPDELDDHVHLATSHLKHMIERYKKTGPDTISLTVTIEDPLFLKQPFTWTHN